jgi:hypothetical protein
MAPLTEPEAAEQATEAEPVTPTPSNEVINSAPVDISGPDESPPTLRNGAPIPYTEPDPTTQPEPVEPEPISEPAAREPIREPEPEPVPQPAQPETPQRLGGPSYTDFDLDKVPVNQLVFKGKPFREALLELVSDSGYNVVIADDVDNSEVTLNFAQKQLSLKSALDLLAQAFDLTWSLEDDAIVVKAKPQSN